MTLYEGLLLVLALTFVSLAPTLGYLLKMRIYKWMSPVCMHCDSTGANLRGFPTCQTCGQPISGAKYPSGHLQDKRWTLKKEWIQLGKGKHTILLAADLLGPVEQVWVDGNLIVDKPNARFLQKSHHHFQLPSGESIEIIVSVGWRIALPTMRLLLSGTEIEGREF